MAFKLVNVGENTKTLLTQHGKVDVANPNQKILEKMFEDGSRYVEKIEEPAISTKKLPEEEKEKQLSKK